MAFQFAQALNCTSPERPCELCDACQRIKQGLHADVQLIEIDTTTEDGGPYTQITITQIRSLHESAHLKPYEGRQRVFIIQTADRLSGDAAGALLKILEEPPPSVVLILVSDNPDEIPATVRSRCLLLEFHPLPISLVAEVLRDQEGISEQQAEIIARLSRGSIGWAIAASHDQALQASLHQQLERVSDAIEGGLQARFAYAEELARRFQRDRAEGRAELSLWLQWLRDMLLIQHGQAEHIVNLSWRETLERHAAAINPEPTVRWTRGVIEAMELLEHNTNPRLALEAMMIEAPILTRTR
jgi:DNA polymerase-3 subunit delta'